jgi:hypothetical protein
LAAALARTVVEGAEGSARATAAAQASGPRAARAAHPLLSALVAAVRVGVLPRLVAARHEAPLLNPEAVEDAVQMLAQGLQGGALGPSTTFDARRRARETVRAWAAALTADAARSEPRALALLLRALFLGGGSDREGCGSARREEGDDAAGEALELGAELLSVLNSPLGAAPRGAPPPLDAALTAILEGELKEGTAGALGRAVHAIVATIPLGAVAAADGAAPGGSAPLPLPLPPPRLACFGDALAALLIGSSRIDVVAS